VRGWSPDGTAIVGLQHGEKNTMWVSVCQVADASCRRVTQGQAPRWSHGDGRLYFVRDGGSGIWDLWSVAVDGTDERRIFTLGTFRAIDVTFDVSKAGAVVWAPYRQGERQVWTAAMR
jgi:hypothetical protein